MLSGFVKGHSKGDFGRDTLPQGAALNDGFAAEFVADVVCGALGFAASCCAWVEQVSGKVGTFRWAEVRDAAADQAIRAGVV